jgi:hypothetical protein
MYLESIFLVTMASVIIAGINLTVESFYKDNIQAIKTYIENRKRFFN